MRLCVLDCSLAMSWVFEDERDVVADRLLAHLERADCVVVPAVLWSLEVRNALRGAVRRKRVTAEDAEQQRLAFAAIPTVAVPCPHGLGDAIDRLVRAHGLTSFDAAYLAIASEHALPLATVDAGLESAARHEKVPLFRETFEAQPE